LTSSSGGGAGNNIKVWASVNGSTGAILGTQSFNVASISHVVGSGTYVVNLTNAMPDQFYGVLISVNLKGLGITSLNAFYTPNSNSQFTITMIQPATGSANDPTAFTFEVLHT
jgi:hypothetical protein